MNCTGLIFATSCPGNGLAYSGQNFTVSVEAKNASDVTTQNYAYSVTAANNFARAVTLSAVDASGGAAIGAGVGSLTSVSVASSAFTLGATTAPPASPIFTFATPPASPTNVFVRATEASGGDGVVSLRSVASSSIEGGLKEVSGRMKISNAYGSELLPLPITATAQYYNAASVWVKSSSDSATQFNTNLSGAGGNVSAAIVDASHGLGLGNISIVSPGVVTFAGGVKIFSLAAPGRAGSANLSIVTAPSYLLTGSITGRATFGVYKGANEFIYMREAY
jgi:MSHA biogenesis protein MshQ